MSSPRSCPRGFLVHGADAVLWTAYLNSGFVPRGQGFASIVRQIAARAGVETAPIERPRPSDRRADLLDTFATLCRTELRGNAGAQARAYLAEPGLPAGAIDHADLGVVPRELFTKNALQAAGFSALEVAQAGVLAKRSARRSVPPRCRSTTPASHRTRPATGRSSCRARSRRRSTPRPPTTSRRVYRLLPSKHRLPLLWLDWSGARVSRRPDARSATTTSRAAGCGCARRRRRPARRSGWSCTRRSPTRSRSSSARARTATRTRACSPAAAPTRCGRRSRRRAGPPGPALVAARPPPPPHLPAAPARGPWARIGEFVGQRDLTVTANTYTHVMLDEAELDYSLLVRTNER